MTTSPSPSRPRPTIPPDAVAYAALTVVAAILRLHDLAWLPLDQGEARWALPAWQAAHGVAVADLPGAPLLFHLQRVLFFALPGGDAWARLLPALAGIALVPLAAGLRPVLGRVAALAVASLLAVDPLWVFFGRQVSPATLSAAMLVLLLGSLAGGLRPSRWWAPVAAALALAAGGPTTAALVAAALAAFAVRLGRRSDGRDSAGESSGPALWRPGPGERRRAIVLFLVTLALAATGVLTRPDGLIAMVRAPADWAAALMGGGNAWNGVVLPLAVYTPLTLIFGIAGLFAVPRRSAVAGVFVNAWVGVALATSLMAGDPSAVADALLPLTLAAGSALGALAEWLARAFQWAEDGVMATILLVVLAYALLHALAFAGAPDPETGAAAWRQVNGAMVMAALLVVVYAVVWQWRLAARVLALATAVAAACLGWANGARLDYGAAAAVCEPMRPAYVPADALRLVRALDAAQARAGGDASTRPVTVDPAFLEALAWPLREETSLVWEAAAPGPSAAGAVIAAPGAIPVTSGTSAPRSFVVAATWAPEFADRHALVRWYFQRRPPADGGPFADGLQLERAELHAPSGGSED